ncbi:Arm DNA-binding domain-containing protein [Rhodospirillum sp. A1_3_36]|uniref:Arm DNA-binding domain-containing protein n=1 Tax=Rhodospirillum sp. A1_3_36 TaxID=3391666 RepID=UPI0039A74216
MSKLTKRFVDQITPSEKETTHWDSQLHGFGLRVWPTGRKTYIATTRVKGRLRKLTIGRLVR